MISVVDAKNVDRLIKDVLIELGIRPNLKGFWYTLDCVKIIMQKGLRADIKIMDLYEEVSKKHVVSWCSVEKVVRGCARRIYDYADLDSIAEILGSSTNVKSGCIKTGEFLWTLADYVDYITTQEDSEDDKN